MSTVSEPDFEPLQRLNADLKQAARLLGRDQVRGLVDLYYQIQEVRKGTANQSRAADESQEPNRLVGWLALNWRHFEDDVKRAMLEFSDSYRVGQWMMGITGIGPVISAGFLAHLHPLPVTVGHWWRFAGYDPTVKWEKKQKRPWNAKLKTLCYKMGDCVVKFCNHPKQFYGTVYIERKAYEQPKNERGDYANLAAAALTEKNYGKDTEARKWYEKGQLPPARIHMRCLRYAVKMFLSHLHEVSWADLRPDEPYPKPYALSGHLAGDHRHYLPPPNFDKDDPWGAYPGRSLKELAE